MTPLAKYLLALIPSLILALLGVVLAWTGEHLLHLSARISETWPKP